MFVTARDAITKQHPIIIQTYSLHPTPYTRLPHAHQRIRFISNFSPASARLANSPQYGVGL